MQQGSETVCWEGLCSVAGAFHKPAVFMAVSERKAGVLVRNCFCDGKKLAFRSIRPSRYLRLEGFSPERNVVHGPAIRS